MKRYGMMIVIIAATVAAGRGFLLSRRTPDARVAAKIPAPHAVPPLQIATVKTVALRRGRIAESLLAYGLVVARVGSVRNVAVPFQSQVLRILVADGQKVRRNEPLVQLEAAPSEMLALAEARSGRISAAQQLSTTQQKFNLHLTPRQRLLAAQQTLLLARLKFRNLLSRGIGGPRIIKAPSGGVVAAILSGSGQIVLPGGPILQLVSSHNIQVQLGIEPADSVRIHRGQPVALTPVDEPLSRPIVGTVSLITRRVNSDTRLVNVLVTPEPGSGLLLGQYIQGRLTLASTVGLIAPRAAVLPVGAREILFTVRHGRAVLHHVRVGLANADELQVIGAGLSAGQPVVTVGNAELTDGMAVTRKFIP